VKYGIPVATLLLLGAAFCLHRTSVPSRPQEVRRSESTVLEPAMGLKSAQGPSMAREASKPESAARPSRPETAAVARAVSGEPGFKLLAILNRELALTTIQQERVDRILRDREIEIRDCHDGIRRSGVLDMRHYEWQVAVMKADWYRKIDGLLDRVQHERFVAIVEQGFFNDGLAFTHEPGMTVLD